MITLEEAGKIVGSIPVSPVIEEGTTHDALNRILGQDIVSTIDMPPFDKSAMDGFAINSQDDSGRFQIVEVISAGILPSHKIGKSQCAKIMTGGAVPEGADRVVKKEVTVEEAGTMRIVGKDPRTNICLQGEDVRTGDVVLKKGTKIRAPETGIIASMGLSTIKLFKRPMVGILATGSELIDPGLPLQKGQIYDSNSYSLAAQVLGMGGLVRAAGQVKDSRVGIRSKLDELLKTCDLVMLSGGVSMGDFDYVPEILEDLGFSVHFHKVAVKPGKPTVFATRKSDVVFGVPGNPVSTFVIFEIFIKPFLFRMMDHDHKPEMMRGRLNNDLRRRNSERVSFIPAACHSGEVEVLPYHGSAHLLALSRANGLVCFPKGVERIPAGETVDVRSIR
jgi:molybdopterin molybdotransferase